MIPISLPVPMTLMGNIKLIRPCGVNLYHIGLGLTSAPYSKSHERRLKRKAKEQIVSGLDDVVAALPPIIAKSEITLASSMEKSNSSDVKSGHGNNKRQPQIGLIGEGKGAPLSKNQRKQVL